MSAEIGYIYIATNHINGKRYIGQTIRFRKRILEHKIPSNRLIFGKALRKYGIENFHIQRIAYNRSDLNEWEKYFIAHLHTLVPNGYNVSIGGDAPSEGKFGNLNPFYGKNHTDEAKYKNRIAHLGRRWSEESKQKFIKTRTGTHLSEETRKKISHSHLGLRHTAESIKKMMNHPMSDERRAKISESLKRRNQMKEVQA